MRIYTLLFYLVLSLGLYAQSPSYKLAWKDNFRGKSINEKYWSKMPRGKVTWSCHMSDNEELYDVRRGKLILYGRVNEDLKSDTARYLTGGVYTKGKKTITYGKVEVKARVQAAKGAWPAIWMLPSQGKWPYGGEIDIMERFNHDTVAYQTVLTHYIVNLKKIKPKWGITAPIDPNGFNVYAVEILPDKLIFSINGKQTLTYPKIKTDKEGQYPFGKPFYLMLDMQIEGKKVGKADPKEYPTKMEIDWVKVYDLIQ